MIHGTFLRDAKRLLPCVLAIAAGGCSPPPRTVEVVGRVTLNGEPVERALVVFASNGRDDAPAHARTDADGRYRMQTFFASHDIVNGAVPNRDYSVYIEKYLYYDSSVISKKMRLMGPEANLGRYLREEAVWDMWPDGVPEGWPLDYVPIAGIPQRLINNRDYKTLNLITQLSRGLPLLPQKYMDLRTSGLTAVVERSDEPQTFDFELTGEVPKIKLLKRPQKAEPSSTKTQVTSSTVSVNE
ncbi:MAG TPA: carboxypeptidase-like regulatory domain-containing protein [Candidatus Binataceae bacterium]|nr:carboxypeptidase-like regulatory domain-containing protein [Candidatus Binataceae bacterium]